MIWTALSTAIASVQIAQDGPNKIVLPPPPEQKPDRTSPWALALAFLFGASL
jgi:hypothetical protein